MLVRVQPGVPCGRSSVGLERLIVAQKVVDSNSTGHPIRFHSSVGENSRLITGLSKVRVLVEPPNVFFLCESQATFPPW